MRGTRRSRRTVGRTVGRYALVFGIASVMVLSMNSAILVTKGDMARDAAVPVVDDLNGKLALDIVDSVNPNGGYRELMDVTNRFSRTITVTVSLQVSSDGVLRDNEDESGVDSVTLDLAPGEQLQVDIDPNDNLNSGYEIYFDVTATATGLTVEAHDRFTTAQTDGGAPGNGGGPSASVGGPGV